VRLAIWITPANKHHRGSAVGIWTVCRRPLRGRDSDRADELARASSLAGKGVDTGSCLPAVMNAGKVYWFAAVALRIVFVWVGSLPAAPGSDRSLAGESWGISIVALPFRLARITSHSWLLPASTAILTSNDSIVLHSLTGLFLDRLLAALDGVPHLTAVVAFDLGPVLGDRKVVSQNSKKVDGPRLPLVLYSLSKCGRTCNACLVISFISLRSLGRTHRSSYTEW
jgi:hypothetical protein